LERGQWRREMGVGTIAVLGILLPSAGPQIGQTLPPFPFY